MGLFLGDLLLAVFRRVLLWVFALPMVLLVATPIILIIALFQGRPYGLSIARMYSTTIKETMMIMHL